MTKNKIKILFLFLFLLIGSWFAYYRMSMENKDTIRAYAKRIMTFRTISDFRFVQLGMPVSDVFEKMGLPDSDAGSGISIPEYYLFGGDSVIINYDHRGIQVVRECKSGFHVRTGIMGKEEEKNILLIEGFRDERLK